MRRVGSAIDTLSIDTRAQRQVNRLSGGNQQKVTIARWLANGFQTLLCFDPTRGIDVGTKRQIYALLRGLAGDGAAILLFTSELAEIPLVCDRVVCLYGGRVTAELDAAGADERKAMRARGRVSTTVATRTSRASTGAPCPTPRVDGRRLRAPLRTDPLLADNSAGWGTFDVDRSPPMRCPSPSWRWRRRS